MNDEEVHDFSGSIARVNNYIRLDHVIGQDEAVKVLRDLVLYLQHPEYFSKWGLVPPSAYALTGEPGTGKTFTVHALANELSCPLIELSYDLVASSSFDGTIKRLEQFKAFVEATIAEHGHVVVFIDEADAFFKSRYDKYVHEADKKTTNFFLRWIDGSTKSTGFTFVVTSNAWDIIDPALRRSGRFRELKYVPLTQAQVTEALKVQIHLAEVAAERVLFIALPEDFLLPSIVNGSDLRLLVQDTLRKKALSCLSTYQQTGIMDDSYIIQPDEILDQANLLFKKPVSRTVGF